MNQRLNGDCVYVTDKGCSIHGTELYPKECADFDCRDNIVPGVRPQEIWEARKRLPPDHKYYLDVENLTGQASAPEGEDE